MDELRRGNTFAISMMFSYRYRPKVLSYKKKSFLENHLSLLIWLFDDSLYEHFIGVKWCFSQRRNFLKLISRRSIKTTVFLWKQVIYCPKRLCSVQQMFLDYLPFGSEVSTATPLQLCHRVKPPSSSGRGTLTREKCDYHWTAAQWQTFVGLEKKLAMMQFGSAIYSWLLITWKKEREGYSVNFLRIKIRRTEIRLNPFSGINPCYF